MITYTGGVGSDDVVLNVDAVHPSLTITPDGVSTSDNPITFTFQFSETVTDFVAGDITITNGSAGTFTAIDGDTYTLDVVPTAFGAVTVNVAAGVAQDLADLDNTAAAATVTFVPALTLTINSSSISEAAGESATTARVDSNQQ